MKKIFISHGLPVFLVGGAAVLRWAIGQAFGVTAPYLTFYPAVVFSALVGGVCPGLLATALSGLIVSYFYLPPIGSLYIEDLGDAVGMGIFSLNGVLITLVISHLQTTRIKTEGTRRTG